MNNKSQNHMKIFLYSSTWMTYSVNLIKLSSFLPARNNSPKKGLKNTEISQPLRNWRLLLSDDSILWRSKTATAAMIEIPIKTTN